MLPLHTQGAWKFKDAPGAVLRARKVARELSLSQYRTQVYAELLGQFCAREKTAGSITRAQAFKTWRAHDAELGDATDVLSERTYAEYWRCMVRSGFITGAEGNATVFSVALFAEFNGGKAFVEAARLQKRNAAALRKRRQRAKTASAHTGNPVSRGDHFLNDSRPLASVSQHNKQKAKKPPQGFGFENSIQKESIKGGSTAELDPFQPRPRPLERLSSNANRTASIAAKQGGSHLTATVSPLAAIKPPMRTVLPKADLRRTPEPEPIPKLDADTSASVAKFMRMAQAVKKDPERDAEARRFEADKQAKQALEAARVRCELPPGGGGPVPTRLTATPAEIAEAIESWSEGRWDVQAVHCGGGFAKLASNFKLSVAEWVAIGLRCDRAHRKNGPIKNLYGYLWSAAESAVKDQVTCDIPY